MQGDNHFIVPESQLMRTVNMGRQRGNNERVGENRYHVRYVLAKHRQRLIFQTPGPPTYQSSGA